MSSINIIEGFFVGVSKPIDSRMVVTNLSERNSIQFKYDGLRVFQRDTRESWIWNSNTNSWESQSSGTVIGTGVTGSVAFWQSPQTIGSSVITQSNSRIGIHTTGPLNTLDLKDPLGGESLGVNIRRDNTNLDFATIGYNWNWSSGGNQRQNPNKLSTKVEMSSSDALTVSSRPTISGSWINLLQLGRGDGWNLMRSPLNGNFISGSMSISPSGVNNPVSNNNLVFINGGVRTNSSLSERTVYLEYNGSAFSFQEGFQTNGSITPLTQFLPGNEYQIGSGDKNIIVRATATFTNAILRLPLLTLGSSLGIGRVITITTYTTMTTLLNLSFSLQSISSIVGLNGETGNQSINMGDTIKLVSFIENNSVKWKVIQHIRNFRIPGEFSPLKMSLQLGTNPLTGFSVISNEVSLFHSGNFRYRFGQGGNFFDSGTNNVNSFSGRVQILSPDGQDNNPALGFGIGVSRGIFLPNNNSMSITVGAERIRITNQTNQAGTGGVGLINPDLNITLTKSDATPNQPSTWSIPISTNQNRVIPNGNNLNSALIDTINTDSNNDYWFPPDNNGDRIIQIFTISASSQGSWLVTIRVKDSNFIRTIKQISNQTNFYHDQFIIPAGLRFQVIWNGTTPASFNVGFRIFKFGLGTF
jgi:hypothetical protein